VRVDLSSLRSGTGAGDLDDAGPIGAEAVRRLGCDATVSRVITRGASEPLDVGRQTPVVPAVVRRALVVRDGGCDSPDATARTAGATRTTLFTGRWRRDIALEPRSAVQEASLVHRRFGLRMIDGRPVFTRMDGTSMKDRAPP
jgi:hypothetical protein